MAKQGNTPNTQPTATAPQAAPAAAPSVQLYATGPATQVAGGLWVYAAPYSVANNPWQGAKYAPTATVRAAGQRFGLGTATNPKVAGSATHARFAAMAAAAGVQGGATLPALLATGNTLGDVRWAVAHAQLVLLPQPKGA